MSQEAASIAKDILPKLTAGGTVWAGIAAYLDKLPSYLEALPVVIQCFAIMCGATLSLALAWKAWNDTKTAKRLEEAEIYPGTAVGAVLRAGRDHRGDEGCVDLQDLPGENCSVREP